MRLLKVYDGVIELDELDFGLIREYWRHRAVASGLTEWLQITFHTPLMSSVTTISSSVQSKQINFLILTSHRVHRRSSWTIVSWGCNSRSQGILYWVRSFSRNCLLAKLVVVISSRCWPSQLLLRLLWKLVVEALLFTVNLGWASTFRLIILAE